MSEPTQRVDMLEQAHRPQVARSPAEVSELQARLDRAEAARRAAETENAVLREAFVKHRTVTHETRPKVCLTCQESDAILARPAPELGQAVLEATRGAVQAYEDYPDRADPADVFDAIRTLGRALLGGWPATAEGQG